MLTAEMRFWWPGDESQELRLWLERLDIELDDAENREDSYFNTGDPLTGLKLRGGDKFEIKKQIGEGSFRSGTGEHLSFNIWKKMPVAEQSETEACQIKVRKYRLLTLLDKQGRKIDLLNKPQNGCQVEISKVEAGESPQQWTTFCLEAYGEKAALKPGLRSVVNRLGEFPSMFQHALQASYPAWLALVAADPK